MRTIQVKLYQFEELSEEAKQTALERWNDESGDLPWFEESKESMKKGLEFYNCKLVDWSFDLHNASNGMFRIESENTWEVDELAGVRLFKYLLNNFSTYRCKYTEETKETLSGNCPFTGVCTDESFLDPIRKFMELPTNISFMELMDQCVLEVAKAIEADYEYSQSMEYFAEACAANEYEFTEDGIIN